MKYDIPLSKDYNDPVNMILAKLTPKSAVLEFGCANGRMTRAMQEQLGCKVSIVELEEPAFLQASVYAEDGICCDIMSTQWEEYFEGRKFDAIIFADVLEHLREPDAVLKKVVKFLTKSGSIWVSIPNIGHNDILLNLLENRFHYTSTGLLDDTHIHFWAWNELNPFFESCGLKIVWDDAVIKDTHDTEQATSQSFSENPVSFALENRSMGRVYEFVLQVQTQSYTSLAAVERISLTPMRAQTVIRRIFYDTGAGYNHEECLFFYAERENRKIGLQFELPPQTKEFRIDLIENSVCVLKNAALLSDGNEISPKWSNGVHVDQYEIFFNNDPQLCFDTVGSRFEFSAEVVTYRSEELLEIVKMLRRNGENSSELSQLINDCIITTEGWKTSLFSSIETILSELQKFEEEFDRLEQLHQADRKMVEKVVPLENEIDEIKLLLQQQNQTIENINYMLTQSPWMHKKFRKEGPGFFYCCIRKCFHAIQRHPSLYSTCCTAGGKLVRILPASVRGRLLSAAKELEHTGIVQSVQLGPIPIVEGEHDLTELDLSMAQGQPLVSIIVPNYNHALYLRERLESIYAQTYPNFEVILLDDASTDNSRNILSEYQTRYPDKTKTIFNETNCGKAFLQWNRGIEKAKGKYIWIAESDDYCSENFLEELVLQMEHQSVMLAFARSVFVQDGQETWNTEQYLADLPGFNWSEPFIMSAYTAVCQGFAIKNIVPNGSSMIFRNIGQLPDELQNLWAKVDLVGDWLFYLYIIRGGAIAYTNKATNYYRIHEKSTSLRVQETAQYYEEQELASKFVVKYYDVPLSVFKTVEKNLENHYMAFHKVSNGSCIRQWYRLEEIEVAGKNRLPTLVMALFALKIGGGETYPLYLANEFKQMGYPVAVLDFRFQGANSDPNVREILQPDVPLFEMAHPSATKKMLLEIGADIVHSHHGSVDNILGMFLDKNEAKPKHIITLHGMYEAIEKNDLAFLLKNVEKSCGKLIYIADKNLSVFKDLPQFPADMFVKIGNGLPEYPIHPVQRCTLGIPEDAFVLCVVSRALPEKGWAEALEAVKLANRKSDRPIHIVFLGEGEMFDKLSKDPSEYAHFMGIKTNTRDYFAMSDMGFLPSRFKGESFPLVIIDSLMSGKPVLATDIAETRNMLTLEDGSIAGELIELNDWSIDIENLVSKILPLANDIGYYQKLLQRVPKAAKKFAIRQVCDQYIQTYFQ